MAGVDLPLRAIREQVASAVDLIVQPEPIMDGTRKVIRIAEVQGMEGDVIVMQDVFVFEQTGVVEGKIQGRLKATGIRPKFVGEVRGHGHQSAARPLRVLRTSREGGSRSMDTMTLVVAGLAAAAIIVIAIGVATSGSGSGMSERLQRYASTPKQEAAKGGGQGPISDMIAQSETLAQLNRVVEGRDFGANLAPVWRGTARWSSTPCRRPPRCRRRRRRSSGWRGRWR